MDRTTKEQIDFQLENLNAVSNNKYTLNGNAQGYKLFQKGYQVMLYRVKTKNDIWIIINAIYRYKKREMGKDE